MPSRSCSRWRDRRTAAETASGTGTSVCGQSAAAVLAVLASGLLMMVKVDTPFYERNPYWLEARTWAMIYVVHGLAALSILSLIIVHIYFAIRPEKLWITRSMIRGWITRGELLEHHDPKKWDPEAENRAGQARGTRSTGG